MSMLMGVLRGRLQDADAVDDRFHPGKPRQPDGLIDILVEITELPFKTGQQSPCEIEIAPAGDNLMSCPRQPHRDVLPDEAIGSRDQHPHWTSPQNGISSSRSCEKLPRPPPPEEPLP